MNRYYRVLSLQPGASLPEIKKAFRKSVQKYHPDANGGVGNTEKFKEVMKAYHHLQKHYKILGIKPVPPKKRPIALWWKQFIAGIEKKISATSYAKQAGAPPRKRKMYEEPRVDSLVLELPYDELHLRFTESDNNFVRKQAARAMAKLFGSGVLPLFKRELEYTPKPVREEIIYCLGIIGNREAILVLEKYMRHPDIKIACSAIAALQQIDRGQARTLLKKLEREGKALWLAIVQFMDTLKVRRLLRCGFVEKSEIYIARALRRSTRQPLPAILQEMGWILPE